MKFVSRAGFVAAALACMTGGAFASGAAATTFMLNPAHDGAISFDKFTLPLKLKWSRALNGKVTYPVIADGRVFVTTDSNPDNGNGSTVYGFDLRTGEVLWQHGIGGTYNDASLAYDGGLVFALDDAGQFYSFDAETGAPKLNMHLGDEYITREPPVADRGTLYISSQGLYALDEETGQEKWHEFYGWGSLPALGGKNLFTLNGWLYSTGAKKGQTVWHQSGPSGMPTFYKGRIFTGDGNVTDARTGGRVTTLPQIVHAPAFWSNKDADYRIGLWSGKLWAMDAATGKTAWSFSGDSDLVTAPIVINGRVAVGSSAGTLYILDAATGTQRWSQNVPAGISPASEVPWVGMAAGDRALAVPGGSTLSVFVPKQSKD